MGQDERIINYSITLIDSNEFWLYISVMIFIEAIMANTNNGYFFVFRPCFGAYEDGTNAAQTFLSGSC